MRAYMMKFLDDDDGAVTVDWVVLTAAILVLGILIMVSVRTGIQTETDVVVAAMEDAVTEGLER